MMAKLLKSISTMSNFNSLWYSFNYSIYNCLYTFFFSLRKQGWRNVPENGPVILVANHQSFLDPIAIGLAARRKLCYLARKSLFKKPLLDRYLRSVGCCPVDLEGVALDGIRSSLELLKSGSAILVFPEGTRSETGKLQELKPGIQLLIRKSKAVVVPVGIVGAHEALPRNQLLPNLSPIFMTGDLGAIAISIGPPIDSDRLAELPKEDALKIVHEAIAKEMSNACILKRKK